MAMSNPSISQIQARAKQISEEARIFVEACKTNIHIVRSLGDVATRLSEEAMILKAEGIADKAKALAIFKLSNEYKTMEYGDRDYALSIDEDTSILRRMIEEIRQTSISDESPLLKLRTRLLGLSFLPDSPKQ